MVHTRWVIDARPDRDKLVELLRLSEEHDAAAALKFGDDGTATLTLPVEDFLQLVHNLIVFE